MFFSLFEKTCKSHTHTQKHVLLHTNTLYVVFFFSFFLYSSIYLFFSFTHSSTVGQVSQSCLVLITSGINKLTRKVCILICSFMKPKGKHNICTLAIINKLFLNHHHHHHHHVALVARISLILSLPYYLPIAGGRIIGFIPFPRVLVLCEMQSVSSRIWTRVAVSIFYDDSHYNTGIYLSLYLLAWFVSFGFITDQPL